MTTCEELELGIVGEAGIVVKEMENHHGGVKSRNYNCDAPKPGGPLTTR